MAEVVFAATPPERGLAWRRLRGNHAGFLSGAGLRGARLSSRVRGAAWVGCRQSVCGAAAPAVSS